MCRVGCYTLLYLPIIFLYYGVIVDHSHYENKWGDGLTAKKTGCSNYCVVTQGVGHMNSLFDWQMFFQKKIYMKIYVVAQ